MRNWYKERTGAKRLFGFMGVYHYLAWGGRYRKGTILNLIWMTIAPNLLRKTA
jgi:hypothetical protein